MKKYGLWKRLKGVGLVMLSLTFAMTGCGKPGNQPGGEPTQTPTPIPEDEVTNPFGGDNFQSH